MHNAVHRSGEHKNTSMIYGEKKKLQRFCQRIDVNLRVIEFSVVQACDVKQDCVLLRAPLKTVNEAQEVRRLRRGAERSSVVFHLAGKPRLLDCS